MASQGKTEGNLWPVGKIRDNSWPVREKLGISHDQGKTMDKSWPVRGKPRIRHGQSGENQGYIIMIMARWGKIRDTSWHGQSGEIQG